MVYVHVCEQAHWACSAGNNAIENVCIIVIQQVHCWGVGGCCSGVCVMDRVMMNKCMALSVPLPLMAVKCACFPLSFYVNPLHTVSAPQSASNLYPQCDWRPKRSGFECSAEVPAFQQQTRPCQGGLFCVELISAFAFLCLSNNKCISDVPDACAVWYRIVTLAVYMITSWLQCTVSHCYTYSVHLYIITL